MSQDGPSSEVEASKGHFRSTPQQPIFRRTLGGDVPCRGRISPRSAYWRSPAPSPASGILREGRETLYRVAANGFSFDAVQLEDIGGLIDGCLVSLEVQQRTADGKSVFNCSANNRFFS